MRVLRPGLPGEAAGELHLARRAELIVQLAETRRRSQSGVRRIRIESDGVRQVEGLPANLELLFFRPGHVEGFADAGIDIENTVAADGVADIETAVGSRVCGGVHAGV